MFLKINIKLQHMVMFIIQTLISRFMLHFLITVIWNCIIRWINSNLQAILSFFFRSSESKTSKLHSSGKTGRTRYRCWNQRRWQRYRYGTGLKSTYYLLRSYPYEFLRTKWSSLKWRWYLLFNKGAATFCLDLCRRVRGTNFLPFRACGWSKSVPLYP